MNNIKLFVIIVSLVVAMNANAQVAPNYPSSSNSKAVSNIVYTSSLSGTVPAISGSVAWQDNTGRFRSSSNLGWDNPNNRLFASSSLISNTLMASASTVAGAITISNTNFCLSGCGLYQTTNGTTGWRDYQNASGIHVMQFVGSSGNLYLQDSNGTNNFNFKFSTTPGSVGAMIGRSIGAAGPCNGCQLDVTGTTALEGAVAIGSTVTPTTPGDLHVYGLISTSVAVKLTSPTATAPTCNAANAGTIFYNGVTKCLNVCDGTAYRQQTSVAGSCT